MPLSVMERKHLLEHGAQLEIAQDLGVSRSLVSQVNSDAYRPRTARGRATLRRVQVAIARKLGRRVDEAFAPPEVPPAATEPRAA